MGQLEKYGLYVLCLVIFLILGVTIWGDPANADGSKGDGTGVTQRETAAMRAQLAGAGGASLQPVNPVRTPGAGGGHQGGVQKPPQNPGSRSSGAGGTLESLLRPGARPPKARTDQPPAGPSPGAGGRSPVAPVKSDVPASNVPGGNVPGGNVPGGNVPAKPGPSVVAKNRTYTVRKGDTLGEIAQRELGSARHVNKIKALNRGLNPKRLSIGKKILLPPRPVAAGSSRSGGSGNAGKLNAYRTYTVSPGDSFARIARIELGSEQRSKELMKLNPKISPRRLAPGTKIKLPLK